MKPIRLSLVQGLCRILPPAIAYKFRNWIYSMYAARQHHKRYTITTLTGARVPCRVDDYAGYLFCTQGYAEWRNWAVALAVCSQGTTVVEVGAQYGLETTGFARITALRNSLLHTFEPLPSNLSELEHILSSNHYTNVVVHPNAVGASNTRLRFVPPPTTHTGIGHAFSETDTERESDVIEVDCVPLDSLLPDVTTVSLICVDVEGYEIPVLQGANRLIKRDKPVIIVEADRDNQERAGFSLKELLAEMQKQGYIVYRLNRFGLDLAEPENPRKRNWNWVGIHKDEPDSTRQKIVHYIRRCGMLPPLAGINPLVMR